MGSNHLVAYSQSVDQAAIAAINAVQDLTVRASGTRVTVPNKRNKLIMAYAQGPNITNLRIDAPSLRDISLPDIEPLDVTSSLVSAPTPLANFTTAPLQLDPGEDLQAFTAENAAGASRMRAFFWLGDGEIIPLPDGAEMQRVRGTSATTLVAEAWTACPITFDQGLRAGWHAIVGKSTRSAGAIASRTAVPSVALRPGSLCAQAVNGVVDPIFRRGNLGILTVFQNTQGVTEEFFSASADTAEVVEYDTVYLGKDEPTDILAKLSG